MQLMADKPVQPIAADVVLERVPPKSPDDALTSFEVADGFRIELVAAEPLVVDPVAMAFDEAGRLYVVEMRDYSEQDKERLGRVRLLSDEDGDGRFETSRIFAEGLSWPTAVACYGGGVFIGNAPDILYCKDTDGDGVADEKRVVFTGFGRSNVQGLLNSFQWGLDNRIHGATSSTGGQISRPAAQARPLDLRGRDFAFDPKTLEIEAETGGGQHGLSFNRWGDKFVCSNSDHLQAIVFDERYLARNPFQSVTSPRRSIAADGPQAAVFRISPVEAWRVARTKMRVAGLAPGPIEGGGQPAGYFTSATGVTVYEGGLWGDDDNAWVYIADVGSNLIHRKRLVPHEVTYQGERVDVDAEFVRSSDIWFRPVQMAIGPEGALYVADMYREVIEHPASLPPELKRQIDLTSGNDRGRIYRIVPQDFRYSAPTSLASASAAELVNELDHPNAWRRATASRLIYERQDSSAVKLLRAKLENAKRPEGRIAMLDALRSRAALSAGDILAGLHDSHAQVRRHALRLSEPMLDSSADVLQAALSLVADTDAAVQFQLALSLGESHDAAATKTLAALVCKTADQDVIDAALTSIELRAGDTLKLVLADHAWLSTPHSQPVIASLVGQIIRQRREQDLAAIVELMKSTDDEGQSKVIGTLVRALGRIPADAQASRDSRKLAELVQLRAAATPKLVSAARRKLNQDGISLDERLTAIQDLALDSFENQRELLQHLISPREPAAIHAAVLAACAEYDDREVAEFVLSNWHQFAPRQRTDATELLLRREVWALQLIDHLQSQNVALTTLDPAHAARLENFPSDTVRTKARSLRGKAVAEDRKQVFADYRETALNSGDASRGKLVFEKNCAVCHNLDAGSQAVGPNLAAMVSRGAESLVFNVLVPNGEVDPRYLEYVVLTADGEVVSGILANESSTAVTIRGADNKNTTVLRVDIDELQNTGKSLMPEGFEKTIDKGAMADLLAYVQQAAAKEGGER
jgi:putative membrane-bound dehydrogenase-like protein